MTSSFGQVIDYEIDSEYNSGSLLTKGGVSDIALLLENESLIIGEFNNNSSPIASGCIISQNGQLVQLMNYGGPSVVKYGSSFLQHGGVIRKYSTAGIDPDFYFEYRKAAYSGFVPDQETSAFVTPEQNILVGGIFFTDSTDISTNSLRQLCMIDSTGAPIADFPMVKCEPYNARIISIDTLSNGEYIIGGSFSSLNGHLTNNVAKLHPDFSVDTSFVSPLGDDGAAFIQYIDSMDRMWMAVPGGFVESMPDIHPSMVRLLSSGLLDTSFTIPVIYREIDGFQLDGYSSVILEDADSTFIVGGNFISYNGIEQHGLIKINDDGTLIPEAFANLGVDEAVWGGYTEDYPGVTNIKKLPEGKLLLGGSFSSFGGEPYSCLVRLKPDGFVGIDETKPREKLKIYPNPAKNTIQINLPGENQTFEQLRFFDLSGRQVLLVDHPPANEAIDISGLSSGMYLLEGRTENGILSGKMVVE